MTDIPIHQQVREKLLATFKELSLGEKLSSDRKLAENYGVALMTMKRVLGDLERDGYIVRQQGRGTFLTAREKQVLSERNSKSQSKGKLVIAYPNYFSREYWERAYKAEEFCLKHSMECVEFKMRPETDYQQLLELIDRLDDVKGIMISPVPNSLDETIVKKLDQFGVPVIIFAYIDIARVSQNVFCTIPDWFQAGYVRTSYLLERGHSCIGYVCNEPQGQDGGNTIKGIKQALKEHGLKYRDLKRPTNHTAPWSDSRQAAYTMAVDFLDNTEATAFIVDSYAGAAGVAKALWERKLWIPHDLSVITNGEAEGNEAFLPAPLTCLSLNAPHQMELAFDAILKPKRQNSHILTADVVLIERDSVKTLDVKSVG